MHIPEQEKARADAQPRFSLCQIIFLRLNYFNCGFEVTLLPPKILTYYPYHYSCLRNQRYNYSACIFLFSSCRCIYLPSARFLKLIGAGQCLFFLSSTCWCILQAMDTIVLWIAIRKVSVELKSPFNPRINCCGCVIFSICWP